MNELDKTLDGELFSIEQNDVFYIGTTILVLFFSVLMLINTLFFSCVVVEGSSMINTLQDGDVLTLNTKAKINYSDIIVIDGEKSNGDKIIKRVIGMGGDEIKIEGGYVFRKSEGESEFVKIDESYLMAEGITFYPSVRDKTNSEPHIFVVGENEIFFLGDNRMNSNDSRSTFGTCNESQVAGVVAEWSMKIRPLTNFVNKLTNG